MTTLIAFTVPDEIAEQMSRESVYLDVFGNIRWSHNELVVTGSSMWAKADA